MLTGLQTSWLDLLSQQDNWEVLLVDVEDEFKIAM